MSNELINLLSKIETEENCQNIYETLIPVFSDEKMYEEQIKLLENLYDITNNPEYLEQIGDIEKNNIKDKDRAQKTYYKYLSETNPSFFKKLKDTTEIEIETKTYTIQEKNLLLIIDRYATITSLMIYFHNKNMLTELFEASKYTDKIIKTIENYVQEFKNIEIKPFERIRQYNQSLSNKLSENKNNKEINELAISYDKNNESAYLNIIDIMINEKKYDEILEFYNTKYTKIFFNMPEAKKASDIIWFLSDKYYEKSDYYNSLLRKKIAINLELGE